MSKKKILIVDDDEAILTALSIFLEDLNYEVKVSQSADRILQKIISFNPDLVMLDLLLADKDGLETAQKIKEDPSTAKTKIIIMTAHPSISKRAGNFKIDGYTEKPFNLDQLTSMITNVIDRND